MPDFEILCLAMNDLIDKEESFNCIEFNINSFFIKLTTVSRHPTKDNVTPEGIWGEWDGTEPDSNTFQELFERFDSLPSMQSSRQFQTIIPSGSRLTKDISTNDRLPFINDFEIIAGVSINEHSAWFPMMIRCIFITCPTTYINTRK
jgi:hypothetical protein